MHLSRESNDAYKVKSYLESMKYQQGKKGIRILHDFHGVSITPLYEVSVKSLYQYLPKRMIFIFTLQFLFGLWLETR